MADTTPRMIRRVVYAYDANNLPPEVILGFKQLRNKLTRAGFGLHISLKPLNELTSDADVVFTPAAFVDVAQAAAPAAHIVSLKRLVNAPEFGDFVQKLSAGVEFQAPLAVDDVRGPEGGRIVRYLGREVADDEE